MYCIAIPLGLYRPITMLSLGGGAPVHTYAGVWRHGADVLTCAAFHAKRIIFMSRLEC